MTIPDDEARKLFEQLGNDQTQAGLDHIAETTADFRDKLLERGFSGKQAFQLSRDMLNALMDGIGLGGEEREE